MNTQILAALGLLVSHTISVASPTVTGNTISWPDDGWYQVQSEQDYNEVCAGGRSCVVEHGVYLVVNHATGERFPGISVGGTETNSLTVTGNIISWPNDGWYQVQTAGTYESICEGTRFCEVESGNYLVINHKTGERYEDVVVSGELSAPSPVIVIGNTVTWPDDGWYQVQDSISFESLCNGESYCRLLPGRYIVINHSNGQRFEDVVVTNAQDVSVGITDREWRLTHIQTDRGVKTPVYQELDFEFTIVLSSENIALGALQGQEITPISGINVCNYYSGGYMIDGNAIKLVAVGEDDRECERGAEAPALLFQRVLFSGNPPLVFIIDDVMTITSSDGEMLFFTSANE